MKLVVCDDDVTLRGVVSKLATDAGHTVLAETDSATDAIDMVLRFGAEVLILDLSLPWGSGMRAVKELREAGSGCQIVVFTSYAADSPEVRDAGVRAVIEKPDFEGLEEVLAHLGEAATAPTPTGHERRRDAEAPRTMPVAATPSTSGIEPPHTFAAAVDELQLGDAVLVVHVAPPDLGGGWYGRLATVDHLLATARALRSVLRVQDRLSVAEPEAGDQLADLRALLIGGGRPGVESVFRRLEVAHDALRIGGVVSAGWALVEAGAVGPMAVARADDAARRSIGRPEGDRLWAG